MHIVNKSMRIHGVMGFLMASVVFGTSCDNLLQITQLDAAPADAGISHADLRAVDSASQKDAGRPDARRMDLTLSDTQDLSRIDGSRDATIRCLEGGAHTAFPFGSRCLEDGTQTSSETVLCPGSAVSLSFTGQSRANSGEVQTRVFGQLTTPAPGIPQPCDSGWVAGLSASCSAPNGPNRGFTIAAEAHHVGVVLLYREGPWDATFGHRCPQSIPRAKLSNWASPGGVTDESEMRGLCMGIIPIEREPFCLHFFPPTGGNVPNCDQCDP